ncbi:hypothetical protein IHE45_08G014900 [Dioscorea alata]|uniref:Uncharacterized protein n=1 Tax=Dioscorea alata TaxID=55571 RepID=A0ACB7VH80_DIOAL|nr:hypothetical protein IHE45_08G014900 [Dioscorea alata]
MPSLVNVFIEEMMKLRKKEKKNDTSFHVEEEKEKMNLFVIGNEAGKGEGKKEKREGISETTLVLLLDRFAPC